jgi:hypothetical protein
MAGVNLAQVSAHQVVGTVLSAGFFTWFPFLASKANRESGLSAGIDLVLRVVLVGAIVTLAGALARWARDVIVEREHSTDARGLCLRILATLDGGNGGT